MGQLPKDLPAQAHGPMRNGALASQGNQARNAACIPHAGWCSTPGAQRLVLLSMSLTSSGRGCPQPCSDPSNSSPLCF